MAIRRPDKLGVRARKVSEAVARAVNDAIDRVYGSNYSFRARSGSVTTGEPGDSSGRHDVKKRGAKVASDWQIFDPKGKQVAGKALEPFARHWVSNYGSIGINSQPGEKGVNFTHLDLIQKQDLGRGQAVAWTYGSIPGLNLNAIRNLAGTGELYDTWSNPTTALALAGGAVAPTTGNLAATITEPRQPGTLSSLFGREDLAAPTPQTEVSALGSKTIKPGMKGPEVRALQGALRAMGAGISVNGVYGDQTRAAVEAFQRANGLNADGVIGRATRPMIIAAARIATPETASLEARDAAAAARQAAIKMPSRVSTPESLRLNGLAEEYARRPPSPLQGAPTIPVERRALPDIQRPLASPADNNAPPGIGPPAIDMANRRRMTPNQMVDAVEGAAVRRMQAQPGRPLASGADNNAPPGIGMAPSGTGDPRLDLMRKALRPVGPEGGVSTPNDPRGWGPIAANRIAGLGRADAPIPRMNPSRASLAGSGSPLEAGVTTPNVRRPDFDFAGNATPSDNRAPPHIGFETPAQSDERIARNGLTPSAVAASYASQAQRQANLDNARRASAMAASAAANAPTRQTAQNMASARAGASSAASGALAGLSRVPVAAAASARPAQSEVERAFDIMSNYQAAPRTPPAAARAFDIMSNYRPTPQAPTDIRPVFSAPKRALTDPAALSPAQAAIAARYSGLAAQYAAKPPAYTATSPIAAAPIPRPNPLAAPQVPGVAAASAVPAMPAPVPPKFIDIPPAAKLAMGLAIPGIGLGIGAMNKIFGGGFNQSTAARNARVSAGVQASDLVGGNYGGASYGRRQSDGSVTGTTRSGTGYTSRDGGREISVGGRTYTKNRDRGGYSLDVSRR